MGKGKKQKAAVRNKKRQQTSPDDVAWERPKKATWLEREFEVTWYYIVLYVVAVIITAWLAGVLPDLS